MHPIITFNPFLLAAFIFGAILLWRYRYISKPGPWRQYAEQLGDRSLTILSALLLLSILLTPIFEIYYIGYSCRVSQRYENENIFLARRMIALLSIHRIPAWLDFASLLNQIRDQTLNAWEQDADFSIIHPDHQQSLRNMPMLYGGGTIGPLLDASKANPNAPGLALSIDHLIKKLEDGGFKVRFLPERQLIQCYGRTVGSGSPHVDLWLWSAVAHGHSSSSLPAPSPTLWSPDSPPMLWTKSIDFKFNPRSWQTTFPLAPAKWLGADVALPNEPHVIARGEYGNTYMQILVFRADCFHNLFQLRWMY